VRARCELGAESSSLARADGARRPWAQGEGRRGQRLCHQAAPTTPSWAAHALTAALLLHAPSPRRLAPADATAPCGGARRPTEHAHSGGSSLASKAPETAPTRPLAGESDDVNSSMTTQEAANKVISMPQSLAPAAHGTGVVTRTPTAGRLPPPRSHGMRECCLCVLACVCEGSAGSWRVTSSSEPPRALELYTEGDPRGTENDHFPPHCVSNTSARFPAGLARGGGGTRQRGHDHRCHAQRWQPFASLFRDESDLLAPHTPRLLLALHPLRFSMSANSQRVHGQGAR